MSKHPTRQPHRQQRLEDVAAVRRPADAALGPRERKAVLVIHRKPLVATVKIKPKRKAGDRNNLMGETKDGAGRAADAYSG